jgi:hypothetical protein
MGAGQGQTAPTTRRAAQIAFSEEERKIKEREREEKEACVDLNLALVTSTGLA